MRDINAVVSQLLKEREEGSVIRVNDVIVKNCVVYDDGITPKAGLVLNKAVPYMVQDADGNYSEGTSNLVFVSIGSIAAMFGEDEELASVKNDIKRSPRLLERFLTFSKISILLEKVPTGTLYQNPFSDIEKDASTIQATEHDSIRCHLIAIKLSNKGMMTVKKFEEIMFNKEIDKILNND